MNKYFLEMQKMIKKNVQGDPSSHNPLTSKYFTIRTSVLSNISKQFLLFYHIYLFVIFSSNQYIYILYIYTPMYTYIHTNIFS